MHLTDLRWWQWAIIGLLLGAGAGAIRSYYADIPDQGVTETMSQKIFERDLFRKNTDKAYPYFSSLRVVPFEGREIIIATYTATLRRHEPVEGQKKLKTVTTHEQRMVRVVPDVPYKPTKRFKGDFPKNMTPAQFLDWVAAKHPNLKVKYEYAWWTTARAQFGIWMIGGLVAMGFIWPTTINLMLYRRPWRPKKPREEEYDLDRFGQDPEKSASGPTPETDQANAAALDSNIEEMEAQLAASSASASPDTASGETSIAQTPVRKLDGGPLEAPQEQQSAEDKKDYAGQFYPTVAHAPKRKEE